MGTNFGASIGFYCMVIILSAAGVLGRSSFFGSSEAMQDKDLVPALVVFGDSTVDAGNNNYLNTIVKCDFRPYGLLFEGGKPTGRFCDGYLVTDYVAEKLGLPLGLPYLDPTAHGERILTGINFASSASGWFDNTASHFNVKGLNVQMEWYKSWKQEVLNVAGETRGNFIISNSLYAFSTGSNDWVNNYYINLNLQNQYTPPAYTTFLLTQVQKYVQMLYGLGGRNMAILGLPPLGCLPAQITLHGASGDEGCIQKYNDVSLDFNRQLVALLDSMKPQMPGARIIYIDIYTYLYEVFVNPLPHGFNATRQGCCGTGDLEVSILCNRAIPPCSDPNEHLFWDSFHPSTHFYSQLSDQLYTYARPIILAPPEYP